MLKEHTQYKWKRSAGRTELGYAKTGKNQIAFSIAMTLIIWVIIQFDGIGVFPFVSQIAAMALPIIIWISGGIWVLLKLKNQNKNGAYYQDNPLQGTDYLILFFTLMAGIAIAAGNYLYADLKPLLIREYLSGHVLYTIRNILYYPTEVFLMLELLICSQKAGDLITKNPMFPIGAVALFVLWGLPHIFYHGFTDGIVSALGSFLYCIPFYASGRNIKTSYIGMLILWLL